MKAILASAAALALVASAGAAAAQDRAVTVTGTVASQCGYGNQSGSTGAAADSGYVASVPLSGAMTDSNGFLNTTQTTTIGFGNVWCNGPNTITLTASQMVHNSAVDGNFDARSFVRKVDMIVDATDLTGGNILAYFGGGQARSGTPLVRSGGGAFETGNDNWQRASVRLALPTGTVGNDRPLAGNYTGRVTMNIAAN